MELERNREYHVYGTVMNLSTAGGTPIAATLKTLFAAMLGGWGVMASAYSNVVNYGPGETLVAPAPWPLLVPDGVPPGSTGNIMVYVFDPNNKMVAGASLPISVQ